jgi:hypothetical protein
VIQATHNLFPTTGAVAMTNASARFKERWINGIPNSDASSNYRRRFDDVKDCSGSRATFELRPLFVCSTLTLLTESLHCREPAVCAIKRHQRFNFEALPICGQQFLRAADHRVIDARLPASAEPHRKV